MTDASRLNREGALSDKDESKKNVSNIQLSGKGRHFAGSRRAVKWRQFSATLTKARCKLSSRRLPRQCSRWRERARQFRCMRQEPPSVRLPANGRVIQLDDTPLVSKEAVARSTEMRRTQEIVPHLTLPFLIIPRWPCSSLETTRIFDTLTSVSTKDKCI